MIVKEPKIIKNLFSDQEFTHLKAHLQSYPKLQDNFDPSFGRYAHTDNVIVEYLNKLVPVAREIFDSKTLLPSYGLFAHYEGDDASLFTHVDTNACTYTIDMCVYQSEPWDLVVSDKPYTLYENEALAYYGNEQMHGRGDFPNPASQHVAMIFFHFVEPDHWWYTKNQHYVHVVRGEISEEEWASRYGN